MSNSMFCFKVGFCCRLFFVAILITMLSPQINVVRPSSGTINSLKRIQRSNSKDSTLPTPLLPSRGSENSARSPRVSNSRVSIAREDVITTKRTSKHMDTAPELALLTKRPSAFGSVFGSSCLSKLVRFISTFLKSLNRVGDTGLANYQPVVARTEHTLNYVNDLAKEYIINLKYGQTPTTAVMIKSPSGTSINTQHSGGKMSKKSSTTSSKKQRLQAQNKQKSQLLKEFYEKAFRTLSILQQCIGHFKTIIFTLTYSRYAEDDLTEAEAKMIRGKSVIGSFIWIVVYALQQMQEDPDVEQFENTPKANPDLTELANDLQTVVQLSLQTWHELLLTFGAVDKIIKKTEVVFSKQTTFFQTKLKAESEPVKMANAHMKNYRRQSEEVQELRDFKAIDPYAKLLTWSNRRHVASSRILYITEYTNLDSLWDGFDPLPVDKKVAHLKELLHFVKLLFESVRESTQKINTDLRGLARQEAPTLTLRKPPTTANRPQTSHPFSGVTSYEDGIEIIDEILSKKLSQIEWNPDEVYEIFETDKVFLDDLDLLVLGACVTREILYEAKHTIHICYDTCRLLDYKEFIVLPSYEKVYRKAKEECQLENRGLEAKKMEQIKKNSRVSYSQDAEEDHLELRNVAGLFRTSQYHDILQSLPVYANRIGMTLQEPEMVFTPSSEKMLS